MSRPSRRPAQNGLKSKMADGRGPALKLKLYLKNMPERLPLLFSRAFIFLSRVCKVLLKSFSSF